MKTWLIMMGVLALGPASVDSPATNTRREILLGTWRAVRSDECQGMNLDQWKGYRLTFRLDQVQISGDSYRYTIDPGHERNRIDIHTPGRVIPCIFRLEGNRLLLCYFPDAEPVKRPAKFSPVDNAGLLLLILERE